MITTADFLQASPETQVQLILDGLMHVNSDVAQLANVIRRLNAWIAAVDVNKMNPSQADRFKHLATHFKRNADLLTEQIVNNAQHVREKNTAITPIQNI